MNPSTGGHKKNPSGVLAEEQSQMEMSTEIRHTAVRELGWVGTRMSWKHTVCRELHYLALVEYYNASDHAQCCQTISVI